MKIIIKLLIFTLLTVIFFISYLSFFGFETKRFNNQITKKVKNINQNLNIELKKIKIVFDPLELKFNAKTFGPKLVVNNQKIEIENIKTQIPLNSLFSKNFMIENLEFSSKSLKINDLISFIRFFSNGPELYILQRIVKKGFLIVDVKLNFDKEGNIKDNYKISGFIKDTRIDILKKYKVNKLNFIFNYKNNKLNLQDTSLLLNDLNFYSKNLNFQKIKNDFLINGEIESKNINLDSKNIEIFLKPHFPYLNIDKIKLDSKNKFSFKIDRKFQLSDLNLKSEISLKELLFLNNIKLKKFLPEINKKIRFSNHKLDINYNKKVLIINGTGDVLLQKNNDELTYSINKKNNKYDFKTLLKVNSNPLIIDFLNYEKNQSSQMIIKLEGVNELNKKTKINLLSLEEENNLFKLEGIVLDQTFKINEFKNAEIDYFDKDNEINKFDITKKKNIYFLKGPVFNANNLIENLINDNDPQTNIINKNFKLELKIDKLLVDKVNSLNNFEGNLSLNNYKIVDGNLIGYFSNNEKFKLTVKTNGDEKITTFFTDKAKPIVSRYKFIEGFDGGSLDFYSTKKGNESISKIRIYDFKLNQLPVLTKLLTLASLQGIADILSGEGIRFNEFEMNFKNQESLMTIDEIYAIGPAISIMIDGYVEKNKLISLRGTMVPATTINKAIGSIPLLGKILVGSKTGEGVFGVSFKIKGPPKNLETTVNPIKTLTPRFITRTLEKIKKN